MNIAELSIRKPVITVLAIILLIAGGIQSYLRMGRLEDPEFTIKEALVITPYPGANANEVEQEVTDEIEKAVQQLGQLKKVRSYSYQGFSIVQPEIKNRYDKFTIPQVWDELRRKVNDAQGNLPPGAGPSTVIDDYGDVYGVYLSVSGNGFSYAELEDVAKLLERELLFCQDVKKITFFGKQPEVVYVEISRAKLAQMGLSPGMIVAALVGKNIVSDAGQVKVGTEYLMIKPSGEFQSVEELEDLLIAGSPDRLIYLRDVATVKRGYQEPATAKMRYDRQPAIGIGISTVLGGNVVTMGRAVEARLAELQEQIPIGVRIDKIVYQSEIVEEAVNGFVINLVESVVIVIALLLVFMGLRSGLIIGAVLFITIVGTFIFLDYMNVMLERVSLGALIISLGMLVDNAIVVTEGILIRIQSGMNSFEERVQASGEIVKQTMWPLLGATVIAVLAFGPIGLSQDATGEFCRSLFQVIAVALLLSWITAITITPLFCVKYLKSAQHDEVNDPYAGKIFQIYKLVLTQCLRFRWTTIAAVIVLFISSILSFGFVEQSFFPNSTVPRFLIQCWLPYGTHIDETGKIVDEVERTLFQREEIARVSSNIGNGALRYQLTYTPEKAKSNFGEFMVQVKDYRTIQRIIDELIPSLEERFPQAIWGAKKMALGPGEGGKIQVRIMGPDANVLRAVERQVKQIMYDDGNAMAIRSSWGERVKVITPQILEAQARRAGVGRPDIADILLTASEGSRVSVFRENDKLLPIIARLPGEERTIEQFGFLQVWSPILQQMIPLGQLIGGFDAELADPIIERLNRIPNLEMHCDPRTGLASELLQRIKPKIDAIHLPMGHFIEWGGELEDTQDAQGPILYSLPMFIIIMVAISIVLFNACKQPLIIWLCVPLAIIGVAYGLLLSGQPFGFMALLGTLSLIGMLIKNAIVLIDEIDLEIRNGKEPFMAVIDSSVSRMRPVLMAAMTTVLGMLPLIFDAFFVSMAVAIMSGLTFATILTLIVVPVYYVIVFRIPNSVKS